MTGVLSLKEVGIKDVGLAGIKAASLGELKKAGMPVADGFVITTKAYREFIVESGIVERVFSMLKSYETKKIEKVSEKIGEIMANYSMPESIKNEIMKKAADMGLKRVAVRASSIDGKSNCAVLNLRSEKEIMDGVKKCWASLYSPENLKFKTRKPSNDSIAVVVQEMIFPDKAGTIETNDDEIRVNGVHGFSHAIDSGIKNVSFIFGTDNFEKNGFEEHIQDYALIKHWNDNTIIKKEVLNKPSFTEKEALHIAQLGKSIHLYYGFPQKIEFLSSENKAYIVNCRKA